MSPRSSRRFAAILFDFDGVVVDSERFACENLAESLTAIGMPCTPQEAMLLFVGKPWADNERAIRERWGRDLPADFMEQRRARFADRLGDVQPVAGLAAFLAAIGDTPRAICSASRPQWLHMMLGRAGLAAAFGAHVYSGATDVPRSKPHPDLYLHAAAKLGAPAADCLVIEDSPTGAAAGLAAGCVTVGLTAGSHFTDPAFRALQERRLRDAGVTRLFDSYAALADWLASAPADA